MLKRPRRVMLLVQAGQAVDDFIGQLIPLLDAGDIIIDGGNSNYHDTMRRTEHMESKGLLYIGTGVSGGGDGYAAGFFYGLLTGEEPQEAVNLGWAHGALLTTFPADTTMASMEQVRAFAQGGSARIQR